MTEEEISFIKNNIRKISQASRETNEYYGIYKRVMEMTSFLNDVGCPISFDLRVNCIINNIQSFPICPECNTTIYPKKYQQSFNKYCSDVCRKKNNNKIKTPELSDYDWLYQRRVIERLSHTDIGNILGISQFPVRNALNSFGLNEENYHESNSYAKIKLRDKEWLEKEHNENHRKCEEIAEDLGVSKSTVSVYLAKHGIVANKVNSYSRKIKKTSKQEKEIAEFLTSIGVKNIELNNRTVLNGFEIDLFLPDLNIGIEHQGLYSHAYKPYEVEFARQKGKKYHRSKFILANEKGVQLIQIFGDQWQFQKDIVKSVISSKVGVTKKIYARNCSIGVVPNGIKNSFLDKNHLQGADRSSIRYGLYHENNLVALMTFNKTRYSKEFDWELCRYCSLLGVTVVGGFSKLLKYFRRNHTGSIISYSDCMWSNGEAYQKNGFELIRENDAGYFYVTPDKLRRLHRNNFRKKNIAEEGDNRTEEEIMYDNGYMKIFDAGNKVWAIK